MGASSMNLLPPVGPSFTNPGITHTPDGCLQPAAQASSVNSPLNPPLQRGTVHPPECETVEPETTGDKPPACWGITPQQSKRERADPPDVARNDLRDRGDRFLRCWGITPQHPRSPG